MFGKAAFATGTAGAASMRAAVKTAVLACCAALLAACSGTAILQGNDKTPQAVPVHLSSDAARPKRMPATRAQDVLFEWGTFGIEPRAFRRDRPKVTRTRSLLPLPDYSESIQEIVANAACRSCEQKPYHRLVINASVTHGVPPSLIHAVIQKESGYNPSACSTRNARGLMQVTPATARFVGVASGKSLYDPHTNIHAGTAYLKYLMRTHGSFDEVLAAYNSGPGNVKKYNGVPPFRETRRYVTDVKRYYAEAARDP